MAWRIVHAARLMPPAPPGASGNPIELLSSGSSSPEHVVAAREVARLREIALASKPHWCAELSFSLGVEKDYVAQVFDLYQPRNLDTLEVCVIGELADELGMDAHALARELKESGAEPGCKPAAKPPRSLDDDDADDREHHARHHSLTRGGAATSACGQATPLLPGVTSTFGSTAGGSNASAAGGTRASQVQSSNASGSVMTSCVQVHHENGGSRDDVRELGIAGKRRDQWLFQPQACASRELSESSLRGAASGSAPDEQGAEGAATGGNGQRDDDAQVLGVAGR